MTHFFFHVGNPGIEYGRYAGSKGVRTCVLWVAVAGSGWSMRRMLHAAKLSDLESRASASRTRSRLYFVRLF